MSEIIITVKDSKRRYAGISTIWHGSIGCRATHDATGLNRTLAVAESFSDAHESD